MIEGTFVIARHHRFTGTTTDFTIKIRKLHYVIYFSTSLGHVLAKIHRIRSEFAVSLQTANYGISDPIHIGPTAKPI